MSIGVLEKEILKLNRLERLHLMQYLVDILKHEEEGELNASQIQELQKRSASIRNGTAEFVTWDEIKSGLKKK